MPRKTPVEPDERARASTEETQVRAEERHRLAPSLLVSCAAGAWAVPLAVGRPYILGRAPESDVVIDDPSVSRRHAVLTVASRITLEDLGSTNGTSIQGRKLAPRDRGVLALGTVFEVGSATLVLQRTTALGAPSHRTPAEMPGTVVRDPAMKRLYEMLDVVAPTGLSVLILGETGVGKEVFAEALHRRSSRVGAPFLKLNCAALPESILEAELFGYEKGAFTGATQTKVGLFEAADGGTLFLDEVGEMAPSTQTKVLRALESGEVMRLGSSTTRKVDVRFLSAANRDLRKLVASGGFRADLFFRLNGITMTLPPLRKRPEDVLPLTEVFLERSARKLGKPPPRLGPEARAALQAHPWPGNVRELRNVVERAVVLCQGDVLKPEHLLLHEGELEAQQPEPPTKMTPVPGPPADDEQVTMRLPVRPGAPELRGKLEEFERAQILEALGKTSGNQTRAAKLLGIARRTLIKKMVRYGIERPRADTGRDDPRDGTRH
ncbi:MAG TPA: sigma 54-interacting transcriptional regulator [Myxococcaceae bacterium]|nr:sigma 54-interacting transcriptional regulator [Myxococcaceae bacterium]